MIQTAGVHLIFLSVALMSSTLTSGKSLQCSERRHVTLHFVGCGTLTIFIKRLKGGVDKNRGNLD